MMEKMRQFWQKPKQLKFHALAGQESWALGDFFSVGAAEKNRSGTVPTKDVHELRTVSAAKTTHTFTT